MTNGEPYKPFRYRQLLEKHLLMTILSEHSITISEIDNMPLLDRDYLFDKLMERQKAIEKARMDSANKSSRKTK